MGPLDDVSDRVTIKMKRLVLLLFLLVGSRVPAFAQYMLGNHGASAPGIGMPGSMTLTTTGNKLVVMGINHATNCTTAPHDSLNSDSLWSIIGTTSTPTTQTQIDIYVISGQAMATGSGVTFTTTNCSTTIYVFGFNNSTSNTGNPIDTVFTTKTVSSGTSIQATSSITPTANDSIVVTGVSVQGNSISVDSGFTFESVDAGTGGYAGGLGIKIQTTATAVNPTWSWTGSNEAALYNGSIVNQLPTCSGSSPTWTAPNWFDVGTCAALASDGDTIQVASGTYHARSPVFLTKYLILKPQTPGGVNIIDDDCGSNLGCPSSMINITESTAGSTRIMGFEMTRGLSSHANPDAVIGWSKIMGGKPVVIQGNLFTDPNGGGNQVWLNANSNKGVIVGNYINVPPAGGLCAVQSEFLQVEPSGSTSDWATPVLWGADDTDGDANVYLEGNYIGALIDTLANGRVVARYNTFVNNGISAHGIASVTGRSYDIYNNLWINDLTLFSNCTPASQQEVTNYVSLGGGTMAMHHNTVPACGNPYYPNCDGQEITLRAQNLGANKGGWPCWNQRTAAGTGWPDAEQVGWGYVDGSHAVTRDPSGNPQVQEPEPVYFWGNIGAGNYDSPNRESYPDNDPDLSCVLTGYPSPPNVTDYIQQGREYFLDADAPAGKPGYTPYQCPHPLADLPDSCDSTSNGVAAYQSSTPPSSSVGLRIRVNVR